LQDVVDPIADEMLAEFVVDSHFKSQAKGANIDDRSYGESQEDQASARPVDPEVACSSSYHRLLFSVCFLSSFPLIFNHREILHLVSGSFSRFAEEVLYLCQVEHIPKVS